MFWIYLIGKMCWCINFYNTAFCSENSHVDWQDPFILKILICYVITELPSIQNSALAYFFVSHSNLKMIFTCLIFLSFTSQRTLLRQFLITFSPLILSQYYKLHPECSTILLICLPTRFFKVGSKIL